MISVRSVLKPKFGFRLLRKADYDNGEMEKKTRRIRHCLNRWESGTTQDLPIVCNDFKNHSRSLILLVEVRRAGLGRSLG